MTSSVAAERSTAVIVYVAEVESVMALNCPRRRAPKIVRFGTHADGSSTSLRAEVLAAGPSDRGPHGRLANRRRGGVRPHLAVRSPYRARTRSERADLRRLDRPRR